MCTLLAAAAQADDVGSWRFQLRQPVPADSGGLFAHDVDRDGRMELIVTSDAHIGAYETNGARLWVREDDITFLPYYHHPSAIAGDVDADGAEEVAYLTGGNRIRILDAASGSVERTLEVPGEPVAIAIANLRGTGDCDALLQYSQTQIRAVSLADGATLWETDQYRGIEHSPLRQADLDGDGLDEVAGASIIDHDGARMNEWDLGGAYRHMDSLVIADILPGLPLEVALAEQRGAQSHTDVVNADAIVFRALNPWDWEDPDKLAVGDFDPRRPGLELFNRSSGGDGTARRGDEEPYRYEEAPWVLDAEGNVMARYYVNDHKPDWWTGHGLEEICAIDWDGDAKQEIVGKERHANGAAAIVDPLTGHFRQVFRAKAVLVYAADVRGDYREEVLIADERGYIEILWDAEPNPDPDRPSYWTRQHYRRQKQNWNYYSP
ncbi:MAG: hypothetical protein U9R79_05055 [Armatimonadota bacterium]|nr:hypothetical protein [Armatimonadota bacterium]